MRKRKLKFWNGILVMGGKSVYFNVAAYSQSDVVTLLREYGHWVTVHFIKTWWFDCWGNSMDGIVPERGVWAEFEGGIPTKLLPSEVAKVRGHA